MPGTFTHRVAHHVRWRDAPVPRHAAVATSIPARCPTVSAVTVWAATAPTIAAVCVSTAVAIEVAAASTIPPTAMAAMPTAVATIAVRAAASAKRKLLIANFHLFLKHDGGHVQGKPGLNLYSSLGNDQTSTRIRLTFL